MLRAITKQNSGFNIYRISLGFGATAFAAFALLFGFAQISSPGNPLYRLKLNSDSSVQIPTIQQRETVKAEIQKQQTVVDTLKKTGAPLEDVKKAETSLSLTLESGKKLGIDVDKVIEESRKANEQDLEDMPKTDAAKTESQRRTRSIQSGTEATTEQQR